METLRRLTRLILESQSPAHSLRPEILELTRLLTNSQTIRPPQPEDISGGETRTLNGLALSPTMAAMCADDFVRTIEFIRGTHAAMVDLRQQIPNRPVRVLYVGCGPRATLVAPLMTVFSANEASFTLLDVHPDSIASARSIITSLGLESSVTNFETVDATTYRAHPDALPDVVLIETMRACLEAEPQVAITRHLLKQSPHAILIPQEVSIDLTLVNPAREFNLDGRDPIQAALQRDRIPVAPVFVLNRETVKSWEGNGSDRLPAAAARMPDPLETRYQPMLFTTIRVYENHILKDYDSGLTCPRRPSINDPIQPGDAIQFHYELGSRPRLIGKVVGRLTHDRLPVWGR